jgi:hypothetical protein
MSVLDVKCEPQKISFRRRARKKGPRECRRTLKDKVKYKKRESVEIGNSAAMKKSPGLLPHM